MSDARVIQAPPKGHLLAVRPRGAACPLWATVQLDCLETPLYTLEVVQDS